VMTEPANVRAERRRSGADARPSQAPSAQARCYGAHAIASLAGCQR
jgi:hypothetical protein